MNKKILILIFLGFFVRFLLLPLPGHEHDMAFWKSWSLFSADKGIVPLIAGDQAYNYPPLFAVFIYFFGHLYRLFKNPYLIDYWSTTNFTYLFLFKSIIISGDCLISFLIYKIAKPKIGQKMALILGLFFFLSPVVIFDGSFWGQVDGLGVLFFIFSLYLLNQNRPFWASFVFTTGFLFRPQNIIYIPLFYLFLFRRYQIKTFCQSLFAGLLAFLAGISPALVSRQAEIAIASFAKTIDYYPYFSLKAANFWSLWMNGHWDKYPDQILIWGVTSAKNLGMFLFAAVYLFACLLILASSKKNLFPRLLLACCLAVFAFFTLPTQMHDRYLFPLFPLLLLLFIFNSGLQQRKNWFFGGFILLSIFYFFNLSASFSYQYQYLNLAWMDFFNQRPAEFLLSLIQTGFFLAFLIYCLRFLAKPLILLFLLVPGIILIQNLSYLRNKPISLTLFLASNWAQDYGRPMKNTNLNSERLANHYFFYDQGIGAHANSVITFEINRRFSRFETDFALDDQAGPQSKVIFQVLADDQTIFTSEPLTKSDLPRHLSLDIKDKKRLILKINDAGDGINGDHADWLGPVLYKND